MKNKLTFERIMMETLPNPNMKFNYEESQIPAWGKDLSTFDKQALFGKGLGDIENFSLSNEAREVFRRYYTMTTQELKEMWGNMDTVEKEVWQGVKISQEDFINKGAASSMLGFTISINCNFHRHILSLGFRFPFDENGKIKPGFIYDLLLTANPVEGAEWAFCLKMRHVTNMDELILLLRKLGWSNKQISKQFTKYGDYDSYYKRAFVLATLMSQLNMAKEEKGAVNIRQSELNFKIKLAFEDINKKFPKKELVSLVLMAAGVDIIPQFGTEKTLEAFFALLKEHITPPKWWELLFFKERDLALISSPQKETIQDMKTQSPMTEEKRTLQEKTMVGEKKQKSEEDFKDSTLRKLARQYADGKISKEEYERLKKILEE